MLILGILSVFIQMALVLGSIRFESVECQGLYGSHSIPGINVNSTINITITPKVSKGHLGVLVVAQLDKSLVAPDPRLTGEFLLCNEADSICNSTEVGKFHVVNSSSVAPILNQYVEWNENKSAIQVFYQTEVEGYYCVIVSSMTSEQFADYDMDIVIRNPYGYLPASFYPALPFFSTLTIVYLVFGIIWMSLSFRYWDDLLKIQHYVSFVIAFLLLEMSVNYGFYDNYNRFGKLSTVYLACTALLNAARNSISFFMLLIVSLGYGVVRPSLGNAMKRCVSLALAHFIFGAAYSVGSVLVSEGQILWVLAFALPLSMTMTTFYMWTLGALQHTMIRLNEKRQPVKLLMYKRVSWILMSSLVAVLVVFVANTINLSYRNNQNWKNTQWKWKWMLLEGALNIIYAAVFFLIALLWRPTKNNQRYGLQQLSDQDPDEHGHAIPMTGLNDSDEDEDETADDILNWVEQNVGFDDSAQLEGYQPSRPTNHSYATDFQETPNVEVYESEAESIDIQKETKVAPKPQATPQKKVEGWDDVDWDADDENKF